DGAGGAWFADRVDGPGGHVDAAGHVTSLSSGDGAFSVAVAPDGAAWFASGTCRLTRATADGAVTTQRAPVAAHELAFDPAGGMWLAGRTRLVHGTSATPCDDTPPRVRLRAKGHVSLAQLRAGVVMDVGDAVYADIHPEFNAGVGELATKTQHGGNLR